MKLSIVIPAFNEEKGIGPTLSSIPVGTLWAAGYNVEKLVVDNASTDRTAEVARLYGARVVYEPKQGYGNAYQAGFAAASGDIIVSGDADMTYPFEALPAILAKLNEENLDFITTNRLNWLEHEAMAYSHIVGNHILSFVTRLLFRIPLKDSQSGMWIFKSSVWPHLEAKHPGMPFSQELKIEAYTKGLRCAEIPIKYHPRIGEGKLTLWDAWRNFSALFKKRFALRRQRRQKAMSLQSLPGDIE